MKKVLLLLIVLVASLNSWAENYITFTIKGEPGDIIRVYWHCGTGVKIDGLEKVEQARYKVLKKEVTLTGNISMFTINKTPLEKLDITHCPSLLQLDFENCELSSIDLSGTPKLSSFCCRKNKFKGELNLEMCPEIDNVNCSHNEITSIKFGPKLRRISADFNQLTMLDFSHCEKIGDINVYHNNITGANMTAMMNSLPTPARRGTIYLLYKKGEERGKNSCVGSDIKIANDKNWKVYQTDGSTNSVLLTPESVSTGIEAVKSESKESAVYTIDGKRIPNGTELQHGIYIIDGKKIIK
ncbi:hypothetical protein [Prevotella sp. HUN102]|uniref:hypothetical protein n=1 Tax=Prevotella sp. HUN102 TaxID=1392486 RepID=UPI00048B4895|nr:hypothetical protein [Prevotella sp. HUN102]